MPTQHSFSSETRRYLSGDDALAILDIINRCIASSSLTDLQNSIFPELLKLFDFEFSCALSGRLDSNSNIIIGNYINFSFPPAFINEFIEKEHLKRDSIVQAYIANHHLQYWNEYKTNCKIDNRISSLCYDFNMKFGYVHGAKPITLGSYGSIFFFSGQSLEYNPRTHAILECLIPHMQPILAHPHNNLHDTTQRIILSDREVEVLQWLKEGKSSWDIASILGISERTVNFHIYNVLGKLDATNRTQAVATALRQNIILL